MSNLNEDIIFLILKELKNDRKSLHSCLMVNRIWCETTVPILWENPCPTSDRKIKLARVIFLYLSEESREILKNQEINLFTKASQKPLFNYISFWRHLDLRFLEWLLFASITPVESKMSIIEVIKDEMLKLLINRNTKFTHIYLNMTRFSYQLHLMPEAEHCFSKLKFLLFNSDHQNVLEGFDGISKSIEKLDCLITASNVTGIIKLMEVQKHLNNVRFRPSCMTDEQSHKALEESLVKHADTIQHLQICWNPVTKVLSHLVNLMSLKIQAVICEELKSLDWSNLANLSFPVLKILKAQGVSFKSLASLIENTEGHLTEISVDCGYDDYNRLIQAISQSCPNLMYIKLCLEDSNNISELEKLLTNCQRLNGLYITTNACIRREYISFDWAYLFKVLAKSSPDSLFKFKFCFSMYWKPKSESLKLFFEGWKGRHPMILHTALHDYTNIEECFGLIEKYKVERIIEKYDYYSLGESFKDFEWMSKNI